MASRNERTLVRETIPPHEARAGRLAKTTLFEAKTASLTLRYPLTLSRTDAAPIPTRTAVSPSMTLNTV